MARPTSLSLPIPNTIAVTLIQGVPCLPYLTTGAIGLDGSLLLVIPRVTDFTSTIDGRLSRGRSAKTFLIRDLVIISKALHLSFPDIDETLPPESNDTPGTSDLPIPDIRMADPTPMDSWLEKYPKERRLGPIPKIELITIIKKRLTDLGRITSTPRGIRRARRRLFNDPEEHTTPIPL